MAYETDWAYDFDCDKPIEAVLAIFNEAGPWVWQERDSAWYGSYLSTYPAERVRVRVHQLQDQYSALLQLGADAPLTREAVDDAFRALLTRIEVREPREIEPYDGTRCPTARRGGSPTRPTAFPPAGHRVCVSAGGSGDARCN